MCGSGGRAFGILGTRFYGTYSFVLRNGTRIASKYINGLNKGRCDGLEFGL